jgi:hypothetical protein
LDSAVVGRLSIKLSAANCLSTFATGAAGPVWQDTTCVQLEIHKDDLATRSERAVSSPTSMQSRSRNLRKHTDPRRYPVSSAVHAKHTKLKLSKFTTHKGWSSAVRSIRPIAGPGLYIRSRAIDRPIYASTAATRSLVSCDSDRQSIQGKCVFSVPCDPCRLRRGFGFRTRGSWSQRQRSFAECNTGKCRQAQLTTVWFKGPAGNERSSACARDATRVDRESGRIAITDGQASA